MMYRRAGEVAPDFTFPDSGGQGQVRLGELVAGGGETLLVWMKTSCPTCRLTLPYIERLHARVAGRDDVRVVVVAQDPPADVAEFRAEHRCPTVPVLCESPPYPVADEFGLTHVPTLFLVGPDGVVRWSDTGFSRQGLEELAARLGAGDEGLFTDAEASSLPAMKPG